MFNFYFAYSFRFSASPFLSFKGKFLIHTFMLRCSSGMTHNGACEGEEMELRPLLSVACSPKTEKDVQSCSLLLRLPHLHNSQIES